MSLILVIGAEKVRKPNLFLDCDGVLANFDLPAESLLGMPSREYERLHGANTVWPVLREKDPHFFENLPLMHDAMELIKATNKYYPTILTGCSQDWGIPQKYRWRNNYLPSIPMQVCKSSEKYKFAKVGDILIDDYERYEHLWVGAGGIFIRHTSAILSILALEEIMSKY